MAEILALKCLSSQHKKQVAVVVEIGIIGELTHQLAGGHGSNSVATFIKPDGRTVGGSMSRTLIFKHILSTATIEACSVSAAAVEEEGFIYIRITDGAQEEVFELNLTPKETMNLIRELYQALGQAA
jgi:hypothetical protein